MTPEAFEHTLAAAVPPTGVSHALEALWWAGRGDWDQAHGCAQQGEDPGCNLVHAYLHRLEGDEANAAYWYRRAGRSMPSVSLKEEWSAIAAHLLGQPSS